MSIRAITDLIQTTLNGQQYGAFEPLTALTEYLSVDQAGEFPHCWITDMAGVERRFSGRRGFGIKMIDHTVRIYVIVFLRPSIVPPYTSIRDLLNGIMTTLEIQPMPQNLTDPISGEQSRMMAIAERERWEVPDQVTSAAYRLTAAHAWIEVDIKEIVSEQP